MIVKIVNKCCGLQWYYGTVFIKNINFKLKFVLPYLILQTRTKDEGQNKGISKYMFGNNSRHTCTFWRCTFTETSFRYKTSLLKKIVWYLFWRLNKISLPKIIFVSSFCRVVAAIYNSLMIISCFILLLINKDRFSHFVVFYFHFGFNLVCWYHIFDKTWKKDFC